MEKKLSAILTILLFTTHVYAQKDYPQHFKLWDIANQKDTIITNTTLATAYTVFVFISPECPLCQRYTRTLNALATDYSHNLTLYAVVPGRAYADSTLNAFKEKYNLMMDIFVDTDLTVTKALAISVTPEAVLFDGHLKKIYTGAIDNWAFSLGKQRQAPTENYLKDALDSSLAGLPLAVPNKAAVGCIINDY